MAAPTPSPVYTQKSQCVSALAPPTPVATSSAVSWAQRQLEYTQAWKFSRGAGVIVAVIDTGVTPGPAFGKRLIGGADLVQHDTTTPGLVDCDGHGTRVAGIIGASIDPKTGFAGVAPDATILSIRQNSSNYASSASSSNPNDNVAGTLGSLATAIRFAVDSHATVINMSLADCRPATLVSSADGYQDLVSAVAYAQTKKVVMIAAAGNLDSGSCTPQNTSGANPVTGVVPAQLDGVLAVGAVQQDGTPASFSIAGSWVGVAAPGTDLVSTDPYLGSSDQVSQLTTSEGTGPTQGTSFSAPYVAGVAALIRSEYPSWTPQQVITQIEQTAAHPASPGGRNDSVGYGVVDPVAAVSDVVPGQPQTSPTPLAIPAEHVVVTSGRARTTALIGAAIALVFLVVLLGGLQTVRIRRRALRKLAWQSGGHAQIEARTVIEQPARRT